MESILILILGWLFGLMSPRIVDEIRKPYRRDELKKSIFSELENTRCKLASVSFILRVQAGILDKDFLEWIQPIFKVEKSFYYDLKMLDMISELSKMENKEIIMVSKQYREIREANRGLNMKKLYLPFLSTHLPDLSLFTTEQQRMLLEITERINYLNEEIDAAWFYFTKTFDQSLSKENREIVNGNIAESYKNMARLTKNMADNIEDTIKKI